MEARPDSGSGATTKTVRPYAGAERGLRRLEAATGLEALARILKSLKLDSMERVDNLETLKELVLKLEEIAAGQALSSQVLL